MGKGYKNGFGAACEMGFCIKQVQKPSQLGLCDAEGLGGWALYLAHIAGIWGINQWPSCGGNAAKGHLLARLGNGSRADRRIHRVKSSNFW